MISIHQPNTKPHNKLQTKWYSLILIATVLLCAPSTWARASLTGGIRAGVTDDPDSGFLGGHLAIHPGGIPLRIEPSFELGFGDYGHNDFITLRFNGNFKYMFKPSGRYPIYLYPIFGLSMYYLNIDDCEGGDCSDTELGVNLGMGVQLYGFLFDLAFGLGGEPYPDITFTVGYTF